MPNWCMNDLTITAPKNVIQEIAESQLSLQKLFPCPQELLDTTAPAPKDKTGSFQEKYGHADWYSWQVANWGTKWDIGPLHEINEIDNYDGTATIAVGFDSAWSPPVDAMQKLYEKYKDQNIEIRLEYFEPGCAFLGVAKTTDTGFFDECYEYENAEDLQSWVEELNHELASSEVDYLREREEEERKELEEKAKQEVIASTPVTPNAKDISKKSLSKKTNTKKSSTKKPVKKSSSKKKATSKKSAVKKAAKKLSKKTSKKPSIKNNKTR